MPEVWDIYDANRNKTGKLAIRGVDLLKEGEYHIIVNAVIINSKNEILITKRAPHKKNPLLWECAGGSILAGETSLEGMLRELKEELGLEFKKEEAIHFKEIKRNEVPPDIKDLWLFKKDINIEDITFPDKEAIAAKWVTIDEFMKMYENKEIIKSIDFDSEDYNKVLNILKNKNI